MPEPWMGDIHHALILCVGSNPAIGLDHYYPAWGKSDKEIEDFFTDQFQNDNWTRNNVRKVLNSGKLKRVNYWVGVKKRVEELLERQAVPGRDYGLTEIVHCKSMGEVGVKEALTECAGRYFFRILSESPAKIITVFGRSAANSIKGVLGITGKNRIHGPINLAGQSRMLAMLPHPSARRSDFDLSFAANVPDDELKRLRAFLRA